MRSADRTLLSSLGFADPDKKEPRHDWACQYLCVPEVAYKLVAGVLGKHSHWGCAGGEIKTVSEAPIMKGLGTYRSFIGFADVVFRCDIGKSGANGKTDLGEGQFLTEVKINETSLGDVLRQLALYNEFISGNGAFGFTVLVTAYPISEEDAATLLRHRVWHVRLGAGFDTYCAQREQQRTVAASPEL